MPELPEVETIRLGLSKKIIGLKIKGVEVIQPKSFLGDSKRLQGRKVLKVWRRAKILGVELTPSLRAKRSNPNSEIASLPSAPRYGVGLLFHLKMTGQLIYDNGKRFIGGHPTPDMLKALPNSHTRVIFTFSNGSKLYFNDQRRFGWVKVMQSEELRVQNLFGRLGPEPLEKGFTWQILKNNLLRHKNMPVKVAILDQAVVSGIGNIYASEACFDAGIDPRTKVGQMIDEQFKALHSGIVKSLKAGIKYGGATRAHFVDAEGRKGYFLDYAYVYGKDKKPCKVCGSEIKKIQLGGRGTFFCPACQG